MKLEGKKILVTGADGFIGSHLVEELVRRGSKVKATVLYNSFSSYGWLDYTDRAVGREIEVVMGDVRDAGWVNSILDQMDVVFHLAALIGIPYSYQAPESYVETNIKGTLNLLRSATALGVERFIHTSTSEVYGSAQVVPISESHPLAAQSPYAASKIGADQLALSFHASYELPASIVRPFNTYGPRQSARAIIPTVISQCLHCADKIEIGSGFPTRDFTFVSDTVSGFIAVAEADRSIGEVVNIGSSFEISITNLVSEIIKLIGVSPSIQVSSSRQRPEKSEVLRLCADIEKAERLTGWRPKYGGLEGIRAGLEKTIRWFSSPENLKLYKAANYNV